MYAENVVALLELSPRPGTDKRRERLLVFAEKAPAMPQTLAIASASAGAKPLGGVRG